MTIPVGAVLARDLGDAVQQRSRIQPYRGQAPLPQVIIYR